MTSPLPPDFERDEVAHEDAIAARYNRDYHEPPILKHHAEDFAAFVAGHYHEGDRVLDLGCGPASLWPQWEKHLVRPAALIGVDISPGMINEARRLYPSGDFRIGTVRRLPLESQSVDIVIASSMLHHLPDSELPGALREIARVLTEHGVLVGREPVVGGRLADEPGWLSGAIMAFRHLACRVTHTREYGEPENGPHHHAYDPKVFMEIVSPVLTPTEFRFRHPFSYYVGRCEHPLVVTMASWFDDWLAHQRGQEFYYAAANNYADAATVAQLVRRELEWQPTYDPHEFMALLQQAARRLDDQLGPAKPRKWKSKKGSNAVPD